MSTLESKKDIEHFLNLQKKSDLELRAICEGMQLSTEGSAQELIDRIMNLGLNRQIPIEQPRVIPLVTKGDSKEKAVKAMRFWRKQIFEGSNNLKVFQLVNVNGKAYSRKMKFISCSPKLAQEIVKRGWYLPMDNNRDVIEILKKNPEEFQFSIVQKPDSNGKSFLMLHVEPAA